MEPDAPIPCCANCSFWGWSGFGPEPLLARCSHEFWACEQDSRFRCHYFKLRPSHGVDSDPNSILGDDNGSASVPE
jgi:hypothetical protein